MPSITIVDASDSTGGTSFTLTISGDVTKLRIDNLQAFVRSLQPDGGADTPPLSFRGQELAAGHRCGHYGITDGSVVMMEARDEPLITMTSLTSSGPPTITAPMPTAGPSPALATPQRQQSHQPPVNIFSPDQRASPFPSLRPPPPPSVPRTRGSPSPMGTPRDSEQPSHTPADTQRAATPGTTPTGQPGPPPVKLPRRASMRSTAPIIPAGRSTPQHDQTPLPLTTSDAPPLVATSSGDDSTLLPNASMVSDSAVYPYAVEDDYLSMPTGVVSSTPAVTSTSEVGEADAPRQREATSTGHSRATTPNFSRVPDASAGNLSFSAALPLDGGSIRADGVSTPPLRLPRRASMKMAQRPVLADETVASAVDAVTSTPARSVPGMFHATADAGGDSMDPRPQLPQPSLLLPARPETPDPQRPTDSPSRQVRTPTSRASADQLQRRSSMRLSPMQSTFAALDANTSVAEGSALTNEVLTNDAGTAESVLPPPPPPPSAAVSSVHVADIHQATPNRATDSPSRQLRTPTSRASPEQLQRRPSMRSSPPGDSMVRAAVHPDDDEGKGISQAVAVDDPNTLQTPQEPEPASLNMRHEIAQWEAESQQLGAASAAQLEASSSSPVPAPSSSPFQPPADRSSPVLVRRTSLLRHDDGAVSPGRTLSSTSPSSVPEPPRQLSRRASMKMELQRAASPLVQDQVPVMDVAASTQPPAPSDEPLISLSTAVSRDPTPSSTPPTPPPKLSRRASLRMQSSPLDAEAVEASPPTLASNATFTPSVPKAARLDLEEPTVAPLVFVPPTSDAAVPLAPLLVRPPPALTERAVEAQPPEGLMKALSPTSMLHSGEPQEVSVSVAPQMSPSPQAPSLPPAPVLAPKPSVELLTTVTSIDAAPTTVATISTEAVNPPAAAATNESNNVVDVPLPLKVPSVSEMPSSSPSAPLEWGQRGDGGHQLPARKSPVPQETIRPAPQPPTPPPETLESILAVDAGHVHLEAALVPPGNATLAAALRATSPTPPPSTAVHQAVPPALPLEPTSAPPMTAAISANISPETPTTLVATHPPLEHHALRSSTTDRDTIAPPMLPPAILPTTAADSGPGVPTAPPTTSLAPSATPSAATPPKAPPSKAPSPKSTSAQSTTLSMLKARRATVATSAAPAKGAVSPSATQRNASPSPSTAATRPRALSTAQSTAAPPTRGPASSSPAPPSREASGAAAPTANSAAERYRQLLAAKRQAADPSTAAKSRAGSSTPTRSRAMTAPMSRSPARLTAAAASSPTRTRIARLTKRLENLTKAASVYEDASDLRLRAGVAAGDSRQMRLLITRPAAELLPEAAQRTVRLSEQLRDASRALDSLQERDAAVLLGLGRITQLIDEVAAPLAAREEGGPSRRWMAPPQLQHARQRPLRLVDSLLDHTEGRTLQEMAAWEDVSTAGRAYREACRLERSIYSELHDRVEAECLMQVHKSTAYASLHAEHQHELRGLHAELQRVTALVRNNTIVMRRKGGRLLLEKDPSQCSQHSAQSDVGHSEDDEEPSALEATTAPVPTPLSAEDADALQHHVATLQREYRELLESQRQHTIAFVDARREVERELSGLQHQRREAAKAVKAQEEVFAYLEARVHGMDPNDKELPELLEACAREGSPETAEGDTNAEVDGCSEGGDAGYVSVFRRHAPKKSYISSRRTADDVRGPTIASIAREEALLETRLRPEEGRWY